MKNVEEIKRWAGTARATFAQFEESLFWSCVLPGLRVSALHPAG